MNSKVMARNPKKIKPPRARRKRRTRSHIIESINYYWLGLIVSRAGHVIDAPSKDYGTDCFVTTHDPSTGFPEAGLYRIQLKATDSFAVASGVVKFPVDTRDLRSWADEPEPRFFVVFDARLEQGVWLHVQDYLTVHGIDPEALVGATMVVSIPSSNVIDAKAIGTWRDLKNRRVKEIWNLLNA